MHKMNMTNRKLIAVLLAATMLFTMACGALNTVTNLATGGGAGTVSELWKDVPPMDGATKADLQLPVFASLLMRTMAQGKADFIAYTTEKTADDVSKFYTADLMKSNGWEASDSACNTAKDDKGNGFTMCTFTKKADGKEEVLALIAVPDEATKKTSIFYVRIDTSSTPQPK
jgi:hypothetical protein